MKPLDQVRWGIVGCGDVCEKKSGPAFAKCQNSHLVAVMRRDYERAQDYARRHNVPRFYDDAQQLIDGESVIQSIVDELRGRGQAFSTGRTTQRTARVLDIALEEFYGGRQSDFWNRPETWKSAR